MIKISKIYKLYKMTNLSFDNLGKPVNKTWKFVSKFLTRTLPIYAGAVVALPVSGTIKIWVIFAQTIIVATISALTELTAE